MTVRIRGIEYYLTSDLIDILPVGLQSINHYLRSGRLRGIKLGRKWYIPRVELDRFLTPKGNVNSKCPTEDIQS